MKIHSWGDKGSKNRIYLKIHTLFLLKQEKNSFYVFSINRLAAVLKNILYVHDKLSEMYIEDLPALISVVKLRTKSREKP